MSEPIAIKNAVRGGARDWMQPLPWGAAVAALVAYVILWRHGAAFAQALDECRVPFLDFTENYLTMARSLPDVDRVVSGFRYPPLLGILLMPLGWLGDTLAWWSWVAFQTVAVCGLIVLFAHAAQARAPRARAGVVLLTLTAIPVLHNVAWGQISVAVTVLVVAGILSRRTWLGAALLALASAVKVFPAIFVALGLPRRDRRAWALAWGVGLVALALAVPVAVMGPGAFWSFHRDLVAVHENARYVTFVNPNSQFLPHVLARWLGIPFGDPVLPWIIWGSRASGVLLVATAALATWRRPRRSALWALGLALPAVPLIAPTSWPHYFAFLPGTELCLFGHLIRGRRGVATTVLLALVVVAAVIGSLPFQMMYGGWRPYAAHGILLIADLLVVGTALALLVRNDSR